MNITEDDIRFYIKDSVESDNPLLAGELRYSSEEIAQAMRTAAREFNSIPPIGVISVEPSALPGDTNVFLDGVTAALLRMTLLNEAANDLQVSGGNVQVQVGATQIAHLKTLIPIFDDRFRRTATDIKVSKNLGNVFGSIGGTI